MDLWSKDAFCLWRTKGRVEEQHHRRIDEGQDPKARVKQPQPIESLSHVFLYLPSDDFKPITLTESSLVMPTVMVRFVSTEFK